MDDRHPNHPRVRLRCVCRVASTEHAFAVRPSFAAIDPVHDLHAATASRPDTQDTRCARSEVNQPGVQIEISAVA